MLPYWILFAIYALGSFEYRRRYAVGTSHHPILVAAGVLTALMIGMRFHVGGDWYVYQTIFEGFRYLPLSESLTLQDPGYSFLNWLAHQLGLHIWFVNLVCGAIFAWGLVKFARQQPSPWLASLVAVPYLIIVVAMGYTRQGAAMGFVLAGLAVFDRISLARFSLYLLGAVLFHKSAIIVLPLVGFAATRNRIMTIGMTGVLGLVLYFQFVAGSMDQLVTNYIVAQYESQGAGIRVAMNLPPALLFLWLQHHFDLSEMQRRFWRNVSIAAILTLVALPVSSSSTAVDRLALYLIPLQMFVLGRLPEALARRGVNLAQVTVGVILYSGLIQFVWLNYANFSNLWVPYQVYPVGVQLDPDTGA